MYDQEEYIGLDQVLKTSSRRKKFSRRLHQENVCWAGVLAEKSILIINLIYFQFLI